MASVCEMHERRQRLECWAAMPRAEAAEGLRGIAGRDAKRRRRLEVLGLHAPCRSRAVTSRRCWASCRAMATAETVAPLRPAQKSRGDLLASIGEKTSDGDGWRCWPAAPQAEVAPGLRGVTGRDAERRQWLEVLGRRALCRIRAGTSWCLWGRCRATATAESVEPPRPSQKSSREFVASLG